MDQRKLIKLGNSSFAIALPKDWVDKSGLKKGDNVFLEGNSNGEIILWSKLKKLSDENFKEIKIDNKTIYLVKKEIVAAYTDGSTTLILTGKKEKSEIKEIKEFIKSLLSFEIIEENSEKIVAKDFFNIEEANLNNFIKRIDNNIKEMFSIVSLCIEKGKLSKKELEEIEGIDIDTTKFWLLISRLFFKGIDNPSVINTLKSDTLQIFNEWWLAYNLEHIGDQIKNAARVLSSSRVKEEDRKFLSKLFSQIYEGYNFSIASFNKKDKMLAINSALKGKDVLKDCEKISHHADTSVAKLGIIFKELEINSYQNLKMVMYSKI